VTPMEFRDELRSRGLSILDFAELTGCNKNTVGGWGKTRGGIFRPFPKWVTLVLNQMERTDAVRRESR